jgi:hypothetical protein
MARWLRCVFIEADVIQSIAWFRPATNPSSDIVECQSTLPPAVCGSVSAIGAVTVGVEALQELLGGHDRSSPVVFVRRQRQDV